MVEATRMLGRKAEIHRLMVCRKSKSGITHVHACQTSLLSCKAMVKAHKQPARRNFEMSAVTVTQSSIGAKPRPQYSLNFDKRKSFFLLRLCSLRLTYQWRGGRCILRDRKFTRSFAATNVTQGVAREIAGLFRVSAADGAISLV